MGWSLLIVKRFYPFIGTREGVKDKLGWVAARLPGRQQKGNSNLSSEVLTVERGQYNGDNTRFGAKV